MRAQVGRENADAQRAVGIAVEVLDGRGRREAVPVVAQRRGEGLGRRGLIVQQKQPARMHARVEPMATRDLVEQRERTVVAVHDIERIDAVQVDIELVGLQFRAEFARGERARTIACGGKRAAEADERGNEVRMKLERLAIHGDSLVRATGRHERVGEVALRISRARMRGNGAAQMVDRLLEVARLHIELPHHAHRQRMRGRTAQREAHRLDRLLKAALRCVVQRTV